MKNESANHGGRLSLCRAGPETLKRWIGLSEGSFCISIEPEIWLPGVARGPTDPYWSVQLRDEHTGVRTSIALSFRARSNSLDFDGIRPLIGQEFDDHAA